MGPKRCNSKEDLFKEFDLSMQMQRKRQKSSGCHQAEPFSDVTAIAEINLEDEREQLFSKTAGNKVSATPQDHRYSVGQEDEMFLSKTFLRAKLENIISKCGIETVGKDVEDCLLMGLGEMMDRLIRNMIRMSKQRVDYEKKRHRILVTSDIHRHFMISNQKCQDQKKPQDEKSNEKRKGADLRLERAARTNKAVRESLGGDDFVSKWTQLSRSRQHEEEPGIGDLPNEKMNKGSKGTGQNFQGKGTGNRAPKRVVTVKDAIRTLEREPQMSKSTFMYRLYERSAVAGTQEKK
ncbi:hypothetical protein DCAR_0101641 [Daucus carota subsp. sativus]|uniref:Uncharacterized protein n=1 Tax=Daucus carota subsp. sativus TaxID=79200 RepID=A0A166GJ92_DAUCS|nr:PREDICTED: transcription initiation factor TFIID subunit 4-like [Daucus carota subsp. sativus]WOG82476.1 hypothetical protein DCAR_0101641 [Daucus carota subsp. sativus]